MKDELDQIIKKIRKLLTPDYGYIVSDHAIAANYLWCEGELTLRQVVFVADGNYQDAIAVGEDVMELHMEEGDEYILAQYNGWDKLLKMTAENIKKAKCWRG